VGWTGGDGGPGTTITDTKTAGVDWSGDIDLNAVQLSLGNNYGPATWSGTITVEFDAFPAVILNFGVPGNPARIDDATKTIAWTVLYGTDLTTLAPTFTLSSGTCSPASGVAPNFAVNNPATYTVTDGATTTNHYVVTVAFSPAPIVFGSSGAPLQTFDTAVPPVTEWSTLSVAGGSGDVTSDSTMDAMMIGIAASSISTTLGSQAGSGATGNAYWRSSDSKLGTQPTGNKATLLMATLYNNSGSTVASVLLTYTLGVTATPGEQIKGHRLYWSKTGLAGSWTAVGDFIITAPGSTTVSTNLNSLNWANGSTLYVVWADDNGTGTEGDYTIDNVSFTSATPPPPILPPGSFTYVAGGVPTFTNVPTTAGYTYWLTYNDSLTSAIWTRIGTGTAGGGNKTFTDTVTPYPAHRFYRLEVQ
jgi:hypothetical protein